VQTVNNGPPHARARFGEPLRVRTARVVARALPVGQSAGEEGRRFRRRARRSVIWRAHAVSSSRVNDAPPAHVAPAAAPVADDVREDGPSPVYYRVPAGTTRIAYRAVLGAADRPAWTSAGARAAF